MVKSLSLLLDESHIEACGYLRRGFKNDRPRKGNKYRVFIVRR